MTSKCQGRCRLSSYINKSDFFAAITGKPVDYEIDGVGLVQVRGLTSLELAEIQSKNMNPVQISLDAVRRCLVAPALDASDIDLLGQAKPGVIQKIADKILVLSAVKPDDDMEKKVGNG